MRNIDNLLSWLDGILYKLKFVCVQLPGELLPYAVTQYNDCLLKLQSVANNFPAYILIFY